MPAPSLRPSCFWQPATLHWPLSGHAPPATVNRWRDLHPLRAQDWALRSLAKYAMSDNVRKCPSFSGPASVGSRATPDSCVTCVRHHPLSSVPARTSTPHAARTGPFRTHLPLFRTHPGPNPGPLGHAPNPTGHFRDTIRTPRRTQMKIVTPIINISCASPARVSFSSGTRHLVSSSNCRVPSKDPLPQTRPPRGVRMSTSRVRLSPVMH